MGQGFTSSLKHSDCDAKAPQQGVITLLSVIAHTTIPAPPYLPLTSSVSLLSCELLLILSKPRPAG